MRKRNRAAAPMTAVQVDDPVFGSVGLLVADEGEAAVYQFDGAQWKVRGVVHWNVRMGRIDGMPKDLTPVKAALEEEALRSERLRTELWHTVSAGPADGFQGRAAVPEDLSTSARMLVEVARREHCERGKLPREHGRSGAFSTSRDPGKEAAAREKYKVAKSVRRAAFAEACGDGDRPIPAGSACERALVVIPHLEPGCARVTVDCPHRVDAATASERRMGNVAPIGPYESTKAHAPGSIECCFYHPTTQARLRLQREVGGALEPYSPAWLQRVREAEEAHPLAFQWRGCDLAAREEVGVLETGKGAGMDGDIMLAKALYEAIASDNDGEGQALFSRVGHIFPTGVYYEDLKGLDAHFWDPVHQLAHEQDNPKWVRWAHAAIEKSLGPGAVAEYHKAKTWRSELDAERREITTGRKKGASSRSTAAPHIVVMLANAKGAQRMVAAYPSRGKQYRVGVRQPTKAGFKRVGRDFFAVGLDAAERAVARVAAQVEQQGFTRSEA